MAKSIFHSFLVSQQKSPHVYLQVVRFFLLGEKLTGDDKYGELASYFNVFAEFLSELATKEVWILRELESQLLTCIQILRNMGILPTFYSLLSPLGNCHFDDEYTLPLIHPIKSSQSSQKQLPMQPTKTTSHSLPKTESTFSSSASQVLLLVLVLD